VVTTTSIGPNPPIELVVSDLDGTLWEDERAVHPRTVEAIARLAGAGIPLLVATGRRVASTRAPLAGIGLAPSAIVLNGALGLDLASSRRFHTAGFVAEDAAAVLATFARWDVEPCVYINRDDPSVWVGESPSTHPDHLASFGSDLGRGRLELLVDAELILAFGVLGLSERQASGLGAELAGRATPHVDRDRQYGGSSLTVAPLQQSKWDGVVAFCREQGIDERAVLAIGDGPNDAELLEHAAIAVVPEDAHASALERADHVVGRAADGGWAELVDLLGDR
jgi:HAD superfamily hydrolase (TIGR01484 family)